MSFALEIAILVLACFNFALPTFALVKLTFKRMPRFIPLPYEKLYSLVYVATVNVPFLVIRAYLWRYVEVQLPSLLLPSSPLHPSSSSTTTSPSSSSRTPS